MGFRSGIAVVAGVAAMAIPVALAVTESSSITPSSIAGAKLGLSKVAYRKLLGTPVRYQAAGGGQYSDPGFQQPQNDARLIFAKRKMYVYFTQGIPGAFEITTWNRAYRTAQGVGPCSSFAQVKKAYGKRLKPNRANTLLDGTVFSYLVGRSLIFEFADVHHPGTPAKDVTAVALYDGRGLGGLEPGGPLYIASYLALNVQLPTCDHS
jgi:hypothetical protein